MTPTRTSTTKAIIGMLQEHAKQCIKKGEKEADVQVKLQFGIKRAERGSFPCIACRAEIPFNRFNKNPFTDTCSDKCEAPAADLRKIRQNFLQKMMVLENETNRLRNEIKEASVAQGKVSSDAIADTNLPVNDQISKRCDQVNTEIETCRILINRINSGTYGICEECEEEIPARRMEAHPLAKLCVPCQTLLEEDEKRKK